MEKISEILPVRFLERMKLLLDDELDEFLNALGQEPPVSVRINPVKMKIPVGLENVPWCDTGFYLFARYSFTLDPLFHAGAYYVQEASSMFLEQVFNQVPSAGKPLLVLDLCGAPGGKSTHLLSLMGRESLLVANEAIRSRAAILSENITKWGYSNVIVTNNDPRDFAALGGIFDIVLVDAPCSGEGLFRKDNLAISEWSPDNAKLCSARQKRILSDAWDCLKPGGFIIYSTCTYNPGENEENLRWMASETGAEPVGIDISGYSGIEKTGSGNVLGYRLMPHRLRGECFFTGVLLKADGNKIIIHRSKKQFFPSPQQDHQKMLKRWLVPDPSGILVEEGNRVTAFSEQWIPVLEFLYTRLRVIMFGLPVGEKAGRVYNPLHNLAVSVDLDIRSFETVEFSLWQALKFLKRETIEAEMKKHGWLLACYKKIPIGWIKNLGNRFNNYYPTNWRIRMPIAGGTSTWHNGLTAGNSQEIL